MGYYICIANRLQIYCFFRTYANKKREIVLRGDFSFCCTSDAALLRNSPENTFASCGTYASIRTFFLPSLKAFLLYEPVRRFYASINVS